MRLIDADALTKAVEHMNFAQPFMEVARVIYGVTIEIVNAPTIDAVEVVRCGDCKWKYMNGGVWTCPFGRMIQGKDGYCSYGERRE